METIVIHTEAKKLKALKHFLSAFDIPFEVIKTDSPKNPEFREEVIKTVKKTDNVKTGQDDLWVSLWQG